MYLRDYSALRIRSARMIKSNEKKNLFLFHVYWRALFGTIDDSPRYNQPLNLTGALVLRVGRNIKR